MTDLAAIVKTYAGLGHHRTGSTKDRATVDWLETMLQGMGADITRHPFVFQQFDAHATWVGDHEPCPLLPLWYAGDGDLNTSELHIDSLDADGNHSPADVEVRLQEIIAAARRKGAIATVVATLCANNGLCAINRAAGERLDFPVVLAPGGAVAALHQGTPELAWHAATSDASAENLSASFNPTGSGAPPLVITTPISGWFGCAGERGTGLAVALTTACRVGAQHPVLLVLNSGHEIGYLGGHRFHEGLKGPIGAVLHIGSCVADRTAYDGLTAPSVIANTNLANGAVQTVQDALAPLALAPQNPEHPLDPASWIGESQIWAQDGKPMLSIAGTSPNFHTVEDTVETCLDADLLETVTAALVVCAEALIGASGV